MALYLYALGSGWDVPLVNLTNVESIKPTGQRALYPPQGFGTYAPGDDVVDVNGELSQSGYPASKWVWTGTPSGYITYAGARTLRTMIAGSAWSGKATVYTKTVTETSYERYNVWMFFQHFEESAPNFKIFGRFKIDLTRMVLSS